MTEHPTVAAERAHLEELAELPEEQRRIEVGYTPVGERDCVVCRQPLAGQVAYLMARHSSKDAACGECVTESRYLAYTEREWTERPVLSRAMWQARYANAQLPAARECEVCGTAFARLGYRHTNQRTCSYDCEAERERRRRRAPKVERPCIVCGELFTPKRRDGKTCSDRHRKALSRMDPDARRAAEKRDEEWRQSQNPDGAEAAEESRDDDAEATESRDDPSPEDVAAAAARAALRHAFYAAYELTKLAAALRDTPDLDVPGLPADVRAALPAWERPPTAGAAARRLLGIDTSQNTAAPRGAAGNRDEVTS